MLDSLRKELLNLTLSNNLLKLREFKAKGLILSGITSEELIKKLVEYSLKCVFLSEEAKDSHKSRTVAVQTSYTEKELEKRLLNTYKEAKEFIDERGVNALYLTLGALKWYEEDSSDIPILSPLLLVPVQIERIIDKGQTTFELKYNEEGVEPNYTLERKMDSEFGIKLPVFDENDSIVTYFNNLALSVKNKKGWEIIHDDIRVNLLSFLKLMMYHDLDDNYWSDVSQPSNNFLIKNLLDNFGNLLQTKESDSESDKFELDNLPISDVNHILDADSSQAEAIERVFKNNYLVIKGPPGTGKSQTITNIIASCIQKGKTVLFVSEKLAALEVVKSRLEKTGLGAACLELHSHKANRREVLESIRQTLEQKTLQTVRDNGELLQMSESRQNLNNYFTALLAPIKESEISPFQAIGEINKVRLSVPEVDLISDINTNWSRSDIRKREDSIKAACEFIKQNSYLRYSLFLSMNRVQIGILEAENLKNNITEIKNALRNISDSSIKLASKLRIGNPNNFKEVKQLLITAQLLLENPGIEGVNTSLNEKFCNKNEMKQLFQLGNKFHDLSTTYNDKLVEDAHNQDFHRIKYVFETKGKNLFRFIDGDFKWSKKQLLNALKVIPSSIDEQIELAGVLVDKRELIEKAKKLKPLAKEIFIEGDSWDFENDTKWLSRSISVEYVSDMYNKWREGKITHRILDRLDIPTESFSYETKSLQSLLSDFQSKFDNWISQLEFEPQFRTQFFSDDSSISEIEQLIGQVLERFDLLNVACQWNVLKKQLDEMGCSKTAEKLQQSDINQIDKIYACWWYSVMTALLDEAFATRPALNQPQLSQHAATFKEADKYLIEKYNRQKIKYAHLWRIPGIDAIGNQMSILRNEINKQRRHLPLRKLLEQAGEMILQIKPVFMMSPLSVAQFLKPDKIKFDYVIFDEASQVKPVEAFGALLRAENAVVVGDDKQLPPSDFFNQVVDLEEVDEENESSVVSDMESILDLFVTKNARQTMLQWHYRSKHESLIAVSNKYFYDDKLINLPSAFPQNENLGLQFRYLPDTIYSAQKNEKEAEYILDALKKHSKAFPNPDSCSIGIVAFSIKQKDCIENLLMKVRKEDIQFDIYMSTAEKAREPFFVKNLENVQGDERDVIFVSICYGHTAERKLSKNFGPINKTGGERRLNVLFTRARLRCVLFSNFTAGDLPISETDAMGLKIFKAFLDYAQNRNFNLSISVNKPTDSPFEDAVKFALEREGFEVHTQIGLVGYFIDLAIPHPQQKGRYLLGIECDGATYHSSRSARERDRLRQDVLEGLGWQIYRIWSTDWFRQPRLELKKLLDHIAILKTGIVVPKKDKINVSEPVLEKKNDDSCTWKIKYKQAEVDLTSINFELHLVDNITLVNIVSRYLKIESPLHEDYVKTVITQALGISRIGTRIETKFHQVFNSGERKKEWFRRNKVLWCFDQQIEKARDRSDLPEKLRPIEWVAPEEIQFALKNIVEEAHSIDKVELMRTTLHNLNGGIRLTKGIEYIIEKEVDKLISGKILSISDNIIRISK